MEFCFKIWRPKKKKQNTCKPLWLESIFQTATGLFNENERVASWCVGNLHCISNIPFLLGLFLNRR